VLFPVMLFVFALLSLTFGAFIPDVPLFMWSGDKSAFEGQNLMIQKPLATHDIATLVSSLLSGEQKPGSTVNFQSKPEVVVLFLEHHLRTDEVIRFSKKGHFSALQDLLQNSPASTYSPYVAMSTPLAGPLVKAVTENIVGSVVLIGRKSEKNYNEGPLNHLLNNQISIRTVERPEDLVADSIFSNGVTDLLIVQLDASNTNMEARLIQSDKVIKIVQKMVTEETKGNFVSIYTALEHHQLNEEIPNFRTEEKKRAHFEILQADTPANITRLHWFNEWFPGWFWEIATVMFIFLSITMFGTCTLNQLQVPDHLPKNPNAK